MKFSYVAIGQDNQKLTGTLEAASLEVAQNQLHKMELSIIALKEVKEDIPTKEVASKEPLSTPQKTPINEIITYYFLAKDPQGKEVNGTIDSNEPYSAYERLIKDYQFEVLDLHVYQPNGHEEEVSLKPEFELWNNQLKQEGVNPLPKKAGSVKNELADEGEKVAEEIVNEIDRFILNIKKVVQTQGQNYSKTFLKQVEDILGNLERIRASNNLNHITKVCNDLFELVSHPQFASREDITFQENQEYKMALENLKESGLIENKLGFLEGQNLEKKAEGLEGIKNIFSKIQNKLHHDASNLPNLPVSATQIEPVQPATKHSPKELIGAYFRYIKEGNPILKRARKQDFDLLRAENKAFSAKLNEDKVKLRRSTIQGAGKRDFSNFFMEVDSFLGWLLFFYLCYFFLASFSLERNVGLSQALVVKTLSSPLVINIFIFLLIAHLTLALKLRLFRQNLWGSTFLFFFSLSGYLLLMANL